MVIVGGDIYKAYDHARHANIIRAGLKRGIPKILLAAWFRHIGRMTAKVQLDNQTETRGIRRWRSLIQGDPSAPFLFNVKLRP